MITSAELRRLCRARERLREARERPTSIRDIANEAAMSPFQFIRRFHAVFGATPHQFRIDARLDRAKTLLADGDISITDVCLEIGFTSLGSFSWLFAQRVGAPPSVYRRRVRSIVAVPDLGPSALAPGCLPLMAAAFAISEKRPYPLLGHASDEPPGDSPGRDPRDECESSSPASWSTTRPRA
jgi:AraC-like DNA-binding protein